MSSWRKKSTFSRYRPEPAEDATFIRTIQMSMRLSGQKMRRRWALTRANTLPQSQTAGVQKSLHAPLPQRARLTRQNSIGGQRAAHHSFEDSGGIHSWKRLHHTFSATRDGSDTNIFTTKSYTPWEASSIRSLPRIHHTTAPPLRNIPNKVDHCLRPADRARPHSYLPSSMAAFVVSSKPDSGMADTGSIISRSEWRALVPYSRDPQGTQHYA